MDYKIVSIINKRIKAVYFLVNYEKNKVINTSLIFKTIKSQQTGAYFFKKAQDYI
jgi:hypothetical protein